MINVDTDKIVPSTVLEDVKRARLGKNLNSTR